MKNILVTGGAGFIGSALVWELNQQGYTDIVISDHLDCSSKWRNLVPLKYKDYIDRSELRKRFSGPLVYGQGFDTIFHLGANSDTTEKDSDFLMENNYKYSCEIIRWAVQNKVKIIYASSAATYGDGSHGMDDQTESIEIFRPLNMYAYSKQLTDLYVKKNKWFDRVIGIKYFNIFGPNEYHKGDMRSVICKSFTDVDSGKPIRLFKSYNPKYNHGGQMRDFLYVKDAVKMTVHLANQNNFNGFGGLFNIGSGTATSWNDVATYIFDSLKLSPNIEYIDMPDSLIGSYQYHTQADITKFKRTLYESPITDIKSAITDYVINYLKPGQKTLG